MVAPGQHAIEDHMDERGLGKTEGVSSNLTSSSSRFCSSNAERTFRKGQVAVSKPPEAPSSVVAWLDGTWQLGYRQEAKSVYI